MTDDADVGRATTGGDADRTRLGTALLAFGVALAGDALAGGAVADRLDSRRATAALAALAGGTGLGLLVTPAAVDAGADVADGVTAGLGSGLADAVPDALDRADGDDADGSGDGAAR